MMPVTVGPRSQSHDSHEYVVHNVLMLDTAPTKATVNTCQTGEHRNRQKQLTGKGPKNDEPDCSRPTDCESDTAFVGIQPKVIPDDVLGRDLHILSSWSHAIRRMMRD